MVKAIDGAAVGGIGVVLPLALGGPVRRWVLAAGAAFVAFLVPTGPLAAALVLPFALVCLERLRRAMRAGDWPAVIAAAYAAVAAGALATSRLGAAPLGQHEPFVELAAVHFTYAGAAALSLAAATRRTTAMILTGAAPPIVALGFLTGWAIPQVGGALVLTAGIWLVAIDHLAKATERHRPVRQRLLFAASGLAPWIPMILALVWAAAQHWPLPALPIVAMVRTHGAANAAAFIACGLVARRIGVSQPVAAGAR